MPSRLLQIALPLAISKQFLEMLYLLKDLYSNSCRLLTRLSGVIQRQRR